MPSAKAFYVIESETMEENNGFPFVEITFRRVYDPAFNDGAPELLVERFSDIARANVLIASGERIACMVTQWQGKVATTMIAKESEI